MSEHIVPKRKWLPKRIISGLYHRLWRLCYRLWNVPNILKGINYRLRGGTRYRQSLYLPAIYEAFDGEVPQTAIADHLPSIFYHAFDAHPRLIVELGTRGGESTRLLLAVAQLCQSHLLSLDIADCSKIRVKYPDRWTFIRCDDVEFGKSEFVTWCQHQGLAPKADVIFLDTSHLYEHTIDELAVWTGHLSDRGVLMLHDTNMGAGVYAHLDGSIGLGWDNRRGVIRAVENVLDKRYDESTYFVDLCGGFLVRHYPYCDGLTVLKRSPEGRFRGRHENAEKIPSL